MDHWSAVLLAHANLSLTFGVTPSTRPREWIQLVLLVRSKFLNIQLKYVQYLLYKHSSYYQHHFQLLGIRGYDVKCRGMIEVKGKGQMETYFVLGKNASGPQCFQRQPSQYNSLAAVVYAMAQTRRKHTGNTSM